MGGGASYYPPMHACMHACCIASGNKIRGTGLCERSSDGICSGLPCCCWLCRRCLVALTLRLACQCTSKGAVPVRGTDNHTKKAVLPYEHAMRARDLSGRVGGRSCASGPTVSELSFFLSFMQCLPSRLAIVGPSSTFVDATQRLASFCSATPARELDSHCSLHW